MKPHTFQCFEFLSSNFFFEPIKFSHGTTTLAFLCRAGIIVAVDSRASIGKFVGSNSVEKVIQINSFLLGTMAGGAADCFFWERNLSSVCSLYQLQNNQRISVSGASKLLANMIYKYKGSGLSIGTMIIGWDQNGPGIYYIDSEGNRLRAKTISIGSGSTFAYGILDSSYRWELSIEEACEIARRAIFQAALKDPFSGGNINIYLVREEGWVRVSLDKIDFNTFIKYNK
nr:26S proteasome SU B5 [Cryptomonas curvata]